MLQLRRLLVQSEISHLKICITSRYSKIWIGDFTSGDGYYQISITADYKITIGWHWTSISIDNIVVKVPLIYSNDMITPDIHNEIVSAIKTHSGNYRRKGYVHKKQG